MKLVRWIGNLLLGVMILVCLMALDHQLGGEKKSKLWWVVVILIVFVAAFYLSTLFQAAFMYKGV